MPLFALLSRALVAFTIELDNTFEQRVPHRISDVPKGSAAHDPGAQWLVSYAIWSHFLVHVPESGISVRELLHVTGLDKSSLKQWLTRLTRWWGYLTLSPSLVAGPPGDRIVRLTRGGLSARQAWLPLAAEIETRWRGRLGDPAIESLRRALIAVAGRIEHHLPDSLPILGYGLRAPLGRFAATPRTGREEIDRLSLPALLSHVLLAFTIDFERQSELSLAISANTLRVLSDKGTRRRDLPALTGISAEANTMALGVLDKAGYAVSGPESPGSRVRVIRLTEKGVLAQEANRRLVSAIEKEWVQRFGRNELSDLYASLAALPEADLLAGLVPHSQGWRASRPAMTVLPHYPTVLHRGGYPDGA
ncbi:hypothetical protein [Silvibacterium sp.]|uniref:hypothetical protein n=1 Tax=Silvibacterium sp. TaxID=1964179 RepID=UPI0039E54F8C